MRGVEYALSDLSHGPGGAAAGVGIAAAHYDGQSLRSDPGDVGGSRWRRSISRRRNTVWGAMAACAGRCFGACLWDFCSAAWWARGWRQAQRIWPLPGSRTSGAVASLRLLGLTLPLNCLSMILAGVLYRLRPGAQIGGCRDWRQAGHGRAYGFAAEAGAWPGTWPMPALPSWRAMPLGAAGSVAVLFGMLLRWLRNMERSAEAEAPGRADGSAAAGRCRAGGRSTTTSAPAWGPWSSS